METWHASYGRWADEKPLGIACEVALQVPSPPPLKGGRFNFSMLVPLLPAPQSRRSDRCGKKSGRLSTSALLSEPGFARDKPDFLNNNSG